MTAPPRSLGDGLGREITTIVTISLHLVLNHLVLGHKESLLIPRVDCVIDPIGVDYLLTPQVACLIMDE